MTEHQIQNAVYTHFGSLPWIRLFRANVGVAKFGRHVTRFGIPGQADLTGIINVPPISGVRIEIEVKTTAGKQTSEQKSWQRMIENFGGIYVLARSVNDVYAALRQRGVHV